MQVVDAEGLLLALLLVRARGQLHVDRGAGDQVLVVAGGQGEAVADFLADQHFGALDGDTAAFVAVVQDVGPVIRQHVRERRRSQQTDSKKRRYVLPDCSKRPAALAARAGT